MADDELTPGHSAGWLRWLDGQSPEEWAAQFAAVPVTARPRVEPASDPLAIRSNTENVSSNGAGADCWMCRLSNIRPPDNALPLDMSAEPAAPRTGTVQPVSGAAEQVRAHTLKSLADAAMGRAEALGRELESIWDAGGEPGPELVARFDEAVADAERLLLEYSLALPEATEL